MGSITSLVKQLKSARFATPHGKTISFCQGDGFYWEPKSTSVFYAITGADSSQLLLHELGHALLGHGSYVKDIELLAMERAAWESARLLGVDHQVAIHDTVIEDSLDTYRDWLHARSQCPYCAATGMQTAPKTYHCVSCSRAWRVNEARTCGLRRYKTV